MVRRVGFRATLLRLLGGDILMQFCGPVENPS
jgi:hypothetical protein